MTMVDTRPAASTTPTDITRAVIYTRQSLDKSGEGMAVARQREECEQLCRQRGWTLVREAISDNDMSASSGKPRPGYLGLLDMIDRREIDTIVVWHVDRLVRRLADLEDVIERCERSGVRLATVSGDLDLSTDTGRLVGRILASVARGEVERKSTRQKLANRQRAKEGIPTKWSPRRFGFERDNITPRRVEADAVRDACEKITAGGTLYGIAQQWNATKGLKCPQGAPRWRAGTVRNVLTNPRIAGLSMYNGEHVGSGTWPALVSDERWRAVMSILSDPRRRPARGTRTLLGGLAYCPCGAHMFAGQNHRGRPIYRCGGLAGLVGPSTRGHVARIRDGIDDYVERSVLDRLSAPDALDLLTPPDPGPDAAELRDKAASIRGRIERLGMEFADDDTMSTGEFRAIRERLAERLREVEAQMVDAATVDVIGPLVSADDVHATWAEMELDRQRAVIEHLATITLCSPGRGARQVFDPETVKIDWTGSR